MTTTREDTVEKTLRWMSENLNGAYTAVHPQDHRYAGKHCTNSGTCVLVCCYINALGKVLLRGGPPRGRPRRDFARFREFLAFCMNDFLTESRTRSLTNTPRGNCGGDEWLYEVYRCGFVHGFYPGADVAWGRARDYKRYWFMKTDVSYSILMNSFGASSVVLWSSAN
jgi:hypothetical protein